MKKTYITAVLVLFYYTIHPNILLHKPRVCSDSELVDRIENLEVSFTWHLSQLVNIRLNYQRQQSCFVVCLGNFPIYSYRLHYMALIKNYLLDYKNQIKNYFLPANENKKNDYYFARPRVIQDGLPQSMTVAELCQLIKGTKVIFYTGAGISAASGVPAMVCLEDELGIDRGILYFLSKVWMRPDAIATAFEDFCKIALYAEPTNAHTALKKIAEQNNQAICTENIDLLHHKTGIRPVCMGERELEALYVNAEHNALAQDFSAVEAIVCIGLSYDDKGLLAYYKQANPDGRIIAIDLGNSAYLGANDYLVTGDIQVVLPELQQLCGL